MADEEIRPEEEAQYADFVWHYLNGILQHRKFPERVYHYTTGAGLIGIIQSGSIWASQIACLNDTKELVHSVDELKDAIDKHRNAGASTDAESILEKMMKVLEKPDPEVSGAFVASFSEEDDDLSQWRAYGGGEGGYAIEFDTKALVDMAAKYGGYCVPVLYTARDKHQVLADIIRWSETFFKNGLTAVPARDRDKWGETFAIRWLQHLSFLAPLIKHPKFEREIERRIIYPLKDTDFSKLGFMQKQSLMSRYIPFRFADPDENNYTRLPITGIVVGPVRHREVSRVTVGDLLRAKGYNTASTINVPVRISQVPYRFA